MATTPAIQPVTGMMSEQPAARIPTRNNE